MLRRALLLLLAGLVAVSAAGCGRASRADDDRGVKFNDVPGYVQEYRDATKGRALPPGAIWPAEPPGEKGGRYEEGVGKTDADLIWRCAWTAEWLKHRGRSGSRGDVALTALKTFPETFLYRSALDQVGRDWFDAGLRGAELGDPTEFQRYAETNC